jgi:amicyanin
MKPAWHVILLMIASLSLGSAAVAGPGNAQAAFPATTAGMMAGQNAVSIDNFSFSPATVTVAAGTTVTWTNHDDLPHNIVEQNRKFKSKALDTDDAFSYTFTEPGTYEYFCGLHPKMVGKIVVEAKK